MADFTILDAPETPAPLFAFRALKGAIFGSPNDDDERNDKENATQPNSAHALRLKTSTFRAVSVSPSKRRKTNPCPSPAKSILRTPGIPTPRKQNTNVTFKDVTPSLSPVLRRQESVSKNRPRAQAAEITHAATSSTSAPGKPTSIKVAATLRQQPSSEEQASRTAEVAENAITTFDFEAYKLSTEKEMKKLVRYGQKMREYARNQEQENTKLRIALEKLQKENEELRRPEADRGNHGSGQEKASQSTKEGRHLSVISSKSASRPLMEPTPNLRLSTNQANVKSTKSSAATQSLSSGMSQTQKPPSPLKRKASTQLVPEPPPPKIVTSPGRSDNQFAKRSNSKNDGQTARPPNARLPPDRLAAARERVRRKAELRKAADVNPSSPVNWNAL